MRTMRMVDLKRGAILMDCRDAWIGGFAGVAYFSVVFAASFVLDTLSVLVLMPNLGEFVSVMLELPIIVFVSWVACLIIRTTHLHLAIGPRLIMSGTAFGLLMIAETGVATLGFERTIGEQFAHYATLPAQFGLAGQVMFASFPVIQRQ